jgi:diguanylate cyclase (GGDEF)-like protein
VLVHYDPLTGLRNRLSLQKVLGRLLAEDCSNRPVAVAVFDLDNFKDVNDTLGHSVGDQLLVEVGQRFTEATGNFDKSRYGARAVSSCRSIARRSRRGVRSTSSSRAPT